MGTVIKYHKRYLLRLATTYLEIYDKFGYEDARLWYNRMFDNNKELRDKVHSMIKAVALKSGKIIKE